MASTSITTNESIRSCPSAKSKAWQRFSVMCDSVSSFTGRVLTGVALIALLTAVSCTRQTSTNALEKADATFLASPPVKRVSKPITILEATYDVEEGPKLVPPDPANRAKVEAELRYLESIPCSIPGFSNWFEYFSSVVTEIHIEPRSMFYNVNGDVDLDVASATIRDGKYYFVNKKGEGVVRLSIANVCLAETAVHEGTHLLPVPVTIPGLPGLGVKQLIELFGFSMQMRFVHDQERVRSQRSPVLPTRDCDLFDVYTTVLDEMVPMVLAGGAYSRN